MTQGHAFLAPSSAPRWVHCALAPTLEAAHPETEESPAALEGSAAHGVASEVAAGRRPLENSPTPNGVAVTREMLEGAALVVQALGQWPGVEWAIETPVDIQRAISPHNWGTPDYTGWGDAGRRLIVVDYKFGHGVIEAFENWQLMDYAAGKLAERGVNGLEDQYVTVSLGIVQPRAYHKHGPIRWWHVRAADLRGYFNILRNAAAKALGPDPKASPSPEACEDCRGRYWCEAHQREAFAAAHKAEQWGALNLPSDAAGIELRSLRRAAAILKARIEGLEAEIVARIKAGERVPLWCLDSAPGKLEWTKDLAEVFALGDMLGVDLRKPADAITPTQAKAAAKAAGLPEGLFDAFASRPPGAVKLTEVKANDAALTFGQSVL